MEYRYELITMLDGQTTLAKLPIDTSVQLVQNGQSSSTQILDITEEQYQDLLRQAATNTIKFDTMTNKIMILPKQQPTPESAQ